MVGVLYLAVVGVGHWEGFVLVFKIMIFIRHLQ